jgi:chemotaxis signal transduction protein
MSASDRAMAGEERMLSFEVMGTVYTLPIASVLEVTEGAAIAAVPSLPRSCGGIMNWHGDALPIVWPSLLFDGVREAPMAAGAPPHVLVVAERAGGRARLGLPVDRVLGLVNGPAAVARGEGLVADRRPIDGRVVSVLDPQRVVARAVEVIHESIDPVDGDPANPDQQGEMA